MMKKKATPNYRGDPDSRKIQVQAPAVIHCEKALSSALGKSGVMTQDQHLSLAKARSMCFNGAVASVVVGQVTMQVLRKSSRSGKCLDEVVESAGRRKCTLLVSSTFVLTNTEASTGRFDGLGISDENI